MNVTKFGSWSTRLSVTEDGEWIELKGLTDSSANAQKTRGYPVAVKRLRFRRQDCTGAVLRQFGMTKTFSHKFIEVLGQGQTLGVVHVGMDLKAAQDAADLVNKLAKRPETLADSPPSDEGVRCANCGAKDQTSGQACHYCAVTV
jgi:hypothetical protein